MGRIILCMVGQVAKTSKREISKMFTEVETKVIEKALKIISSKFKKTTDQLSSSKLTKAYLSLTLTVLEYEVFVVVHLDTQHRVIDVEELFRGTIDGCAVYPREVVKSALSKNSSAVIFAHNHPSGMAEPSQADISITSRLKIALETVDIRTLDHIIIGQGESVSLMERGLL